MSAVKKSKRFRVDRDTVETLERYASDWEITPNKLLLRALADYLEGGPFEYLPPKSHRAKVYREFRHLLIEKSFTIPTPMLDAVRHRAALEGITQNFLFERAVSHYIFAEEARPDADIVKNDLRWLAYLPSDEPDINDEWPDIIDG